MSENNVIKSIIQSKCPHCDKDIFIESQMVPPAVTSVFTPEDVEKAKKECMSRVETLDIDDEKKDAIKKWLDDPRTVFGPGEVENIILSLVKPEE